MSVAQLKAAMAAAGNGKIKDNESALLKGTANVHTPPEGRAPGTLNARWGDHPPTSPTKDTAVHGTAVEQAAHDDRNGMIERLFDSPGSSAPTEQKLMEGYFTAPKDGFPHSPLLQRGHLDKTAQDETLAQQVRRVI